MASMRARGVALLERLGMEYDEHYERRYGDRHLVKVIEVFLTDSQIAARHPGEATSLVCFGWRDVYDRVVQL